MLMVDLAQSHKAQRTGRPSLAFSLVAVPASFAASLPQDKDSTQETGKRSWQAGQAGHNFGRLAGNYSGCEIEISSPSESLASAQPQNKR